MIHKCFSIFVTLFSVTVIIAQTPCVYGFAGAYPCSNYDLMGHIPVSTLANTGGTPEGSDIWGWTDATTGKEYALVATTNSTAFVDVSDPIQPVFLGRLDSNAGNNYWRDVKVYNNFAFIVADNVGAHGMQVFDLTKLRNVSNPPISFSSDAIYNTDNVGSCHNIVINEDKAVAYLVGCRDTSNQRIYNGGPIFVDISDPLNPTSLGGYADEGYSHDAQVVSYNGPDSDYTGKEIYIGSNENDIAILDVTDKNNVVKIAEINYQQIGYTHQGWFTEDQRYFILGDELDEQNFGMNTRTLVFDFIDLDNPVLSSTYYGPTTAIDHNGYVKGNEYYMANYRAGMRVLDITNIGSGNDATSMTETGYFDTYPTNDSAAFNGLWSVYPYFESGTIILNDIESGLFLLKKSGTLSSTNYVLNKEFSIFPNPTDTNPTITSSQSTRLTAVEIYNIIGQKLFSAQNLSTNELVIPTENLVKGIYFVKINGKVTRKLIVK